MDQIAENMRVRTIINAARRQGLLDSKNRRVGVRISPRLVEEAKRQTGIETDTDLIEFALASLAVEQPYGFALMDLRGTVDPDVDLTF